MARPPPGRMPPQNARKSPRQAWAGRNPVGAAAGDWLGAPPDAGPDDRAPTADWHDGDSDAMFCCKHCNAGRPPVGTPEHIAW